MRDLSCAGVGLAFLLLREESIAGRESRRLGLLKLECFA